MKMVSLMVESYHMKTAGEAEEVFSQEIDYKG